MDAIGAHAPEPDDKDMFEAIVAGIDGAELEQAATAPAPAPPVPEPMLGAQTNSHTEDALPAPEIEEALSAPHPPAPAAAAATPLIDLDVPPELVVPPPPVRKQSMIDWCATAFPHLVWLSVIAGLVGQVYGWSETFGGGPVGWVVAGTLGGVFEFIMVAASSKGLKDLGLGRSWWQVAAFLAVGTACAALAFGMNLKHFTGVLAMAGIAAAAATALGYLAHVGVHFFEELDNRRALQTWQAAADGIEREIKARAAKARADHDALQAKARELRIAQLGKHIDSQLPQATSVVPASSPSASTTSRPQKPRPTSAPVNSAERKPGERATKADAVRIGVERKVDKPAGLRNALIDAGYRLPSSPTTIENWCKEIKKQLADAS